MCIAENVVARALRDEIRWMGRKKMGLPAGAVRGRRSPQLRLRGRSVSWILLEAAAVLWKFRRKKQ